MRIVLAISASILSRPRQRAVTQTPRSSTTFARMSEARVFSLEATFTDPLRQSLFTLLKAPLEKLLSFSELERLYAIARNRGDGDFIDALLMALGVDIDVAANDLARIPRTGPVLVVANHPYGGIEGIALLAMLRRVRPDVRVMANFMLNRIPEMREHIIPVDPFDNANALKRNVGPLRETVRHLTEGGMIGIFPSGEVSSVDLATMTVEDPQWSETVARIARKHGIPVLPVYFDGSNGAAFQIAGLVHPRLRTAMLPREFARSSGRVLRTRIGKVIQPLAYEQYATDRELVDFLRVRTYLLKNRGAPQPMAAESSRPGLVAVAPAGDHALLRDEVAKLADNRLCGSGELSVYAAHASKIPNVLYEIGRQREIAFREVAEGTGRAIDLDRFDEHYVHLFVWNATAGEVVGAYRLGQTDRILKRFGVEGLYTHTLFAYDEELMARLGPALEMGRSFVRSSYQKQYASLLLLWKGIGQYVARHPHYRSLFGPVSINNAYTSMSRQLIAAFLTTNATVPDLQKLVKPRTPLQRTPNVIATSRVVKDIDQVSELISELEADQKGLPVLLRQYLKLGGKLLGFNVDNDFGEVLDGLIVVNLDETEPRILEKYLGREQSAAFSRYASEGLAVSA